MVLACQAQGQSCSPQRCLSLPDLRPRILSVLKSLVKRRDGSAHRVTAVVKSRPAIGTRLTWKRIPSTWLNNLQVEFFGIFISSSYSYSKATRKLHVFITRKLHVLSWKGRFLSSVSQSTYWLNVPRASSMFSRIRARSCSGSIGKILRSGSGTLGRTPGFCSATLGRTLGPCSGKTRAH